MKSVSHILEMKSLSYILVLWFGLLVWQPGRAAQRLTPAAEISLMTVGQGNELYSTFWHNAMRVQDPGLNLDVIYNYGTFDFSEGFYMKFMMGKLNYILGRETFNRFFQSYRAEGRSIYAQVLDLEQDEKQKVYDFLENNYLPENREYLYNFVDDNCATRIRDLMEHVFGDQLKWGDNLGDRNPTIRDLLDEYLVNMPQEDFGIDLLLGATNDKRADVRTAQFLPEYTFKAFEGAMVTRNGESRPLVKAKNDTFIAPERNSKPGLFGRPGTWLWLLFILTMGLTLFGAIQNNRMVLLDFLLLLLVGALGSFLLFMWVGTDHTVTVWNLNLLWAFPLHIFAAWLVFIRNKPLWLKRYFQISWLILVLATVGYLILPQSYNPAIWPLIFTLMMRTGVLGFG